MSPALFVEVLDRRGRVQHRVRIDALPATIGRGYHNAVILDDHYVSPEHARIELDGNGGMVLVDLDSENGLFESGHHRRSPRVPLASGGTSLRVGNTVIRIVPADQPVPPTLREPFTGHPLGRFIRSPQGALLLALAALASKVVSTWLGTYEALDPAQLLSNAVALLMLLLLWTSAWALATRPRLHRALFLPHLAMASAAAVAGDLVRVVGSFAQTMLPQLAAGVLAWAGTGATIAILGGLVYAQLGLASGLTRRPRAAWSFGVVITLLAFVEVVEFADRDRHDLDVTFQGELQAVAPALVSATDLEPFLETLEHLKVDVDDVAARPR